MANKNIRSAAYKTVAKPIRVKFKTKSGETVYIRALKTVQQKVNVRPRSKKK